MDNMLKRLREPSTYAGLSGIAIALGLSIEEYQAIANIAAGACALIAMFKGEQET